MIAGCAGVMYCNHTLNVNVIRLKVRGGAYGIKNEITLLFFTTENMLCMQLPYLGVVHMRDNTQSFLV